MKRAFLAFILFLLLTVFETSFLASLPRPFLYTPLVLAASVYLIQHRSSRIGLWWLLGYGLFLDVTHLGFTAAETIVYLITGILTYLVSRHMFTNRSLYGVISGGVVAFVSSSVLHLLILLLERIYSQNIFLWLEWLNMLFWQATLLLILLLIIFYVAQSLWGRNR